MASAVQFGDLPAELILSVGDHLEELDLCCLAQTSWRINQLLRPSLRKAALAYALADQEEYDKRILNDGPDLAVINDWFEGFPKEPLAECILAGRHDSVNAFLNFGIDPNAYTVMGVRMLKLAIYHCQFEIADLFLEHGADPSLPDIGGEDTEVPLCIAARVASDYMVERLIEAGADLTVPFVTHEIARFCKLETVELVASKGVDMFTLFSDGSTVLHCAVLNEDSRVPEFLLNFGLHRIVSVQNARGETALWNALSAGNHSVVELLFRAGVDVHVQDRMGSTALHAAALYAQHEAVKYLLSQGVRINRGAENNMSELQYAVFGGDIGIIEMLLEAGADANWMSHSRETVLHLAAAHDRGDIVKRLVAAHADASIVDSNGQTPQHIALARGYFDTAGCF